MSNDEADWREQDADASSPFEPDEVSTSPQIKLPSPKHDGIKWSLQPTRYAPGYLTLQNWSDDILFNFQHLNCFQLTPYRRFELPPTLTILKQHAKALCLLLHLLQPSPPGTGPCSWPGEVFRAPFEWLENLEHPYLAEGVSEDEWSDSLNQLVNRKHPKKPRIDGRCTAELIRDANIVLTSLHFIIQPKHPSLLSLNLASPQRYPVFAEWLTFTHELRNRVAAFKEEVRFLKETLISEAVAPSARCKEIRLAAAPESYSLNYPADRYVLAGLSEGLWNRLTEELKGKEMDEWRDKKEESAARQGTPKFEFIDDSDEDDDEYDEDDPRVTWIETTSRLYTVNNIEQHIFVIPGVGEEHGNMTLHREQEEWLLARHEREMERFNETIEQLAREQTELRKEIENEKISRGEARHEANPQPRLGTKRAPQQPAPPPPRPAVAGSFRPLEIPSEGPIIPISNTPRAKPVPPTTAADPKTRSYSAFRPARLIIGQTVGLGTVAVGSQTQAPAPAPAPAQHQQ